MKTENEKKFKDELEAFLDKHDLHLEEHEIYDGNERYSGSEFYFVSNSDLIEDTVFMNLREFV